MFQKYEMMLKGKWIPTAAPLEAGTRSYHISTLYSNFFDWYQCACKWVNAGSDKNKLQTFVNNQLGETWKEDVKTINDDSMQKNNTRPYRPGTIPNALAERDGNGKIVCLIASVDVNGMHQNPEGWLAIHIRGHCRGGQTYDIAKTQLHGNTDVGGNAWLALREILDKPYFDESGMEYHMIASGVDSSPKTKATYAFCSQASNYIAVRGRPKTAANDRIVMRAKNAQGEMWSIDTVYYKNNIAAATQAGWSSMTGVAQPPDFMNFPKDKFFDGLKNTEFEDKYKVNMIGDGFNDLFFKNFSAEKPIIHREDPADEIGVVIGWEKTNTRRFNHFFDTTVYNLAMLDIACKVLAESNPDTKNYDTRKIVGSMADFLETEGRPFY
jgi:phage terminase large subunit GpA-like protein